MVFHLNTTEVGYILEALNRLHYELKIPAQVADVEALSRSIRKQWSDGLGGVSTAPTRCAVETATGASFTETLKPTLSERGNFPRRPYDPEEARANAS